MTRDKDHRAARASEFWHWNKKGPTKKRIWRKLHKGARQEAKLQIRKEQGHGHFQGRTHPDR